MTVNFVLVGGIVKDGVEGSKTCIIVLLVLVLVQGVVVVAGGGVMVPIAGNLVVVSEFPCGPFECMETPKTFLHRALIEIGAGGSDP